MRFWIALMIALSFALVVKPVEAKPAAAEMERAKTLFRAGARAYRAGNFSASLQAFEQAYAIDPKPAIRFSAAQALRRWYAVSEDPEHLRQALAYYREYLAVVKTGGRVLDASRAKNEIEILLAQLGEPDETPVDGEEPTAPRRVPATRGTLMIDGPVVAKAKTFIDGKLREGWPVFAELPPGRYAVRVEAPGYRIYERAWNTVAGQLTPVEVQLEEKPGRLDIAASDSAELLVDGRPMGRIPLSEPLELPSGSHRVVVGTSGYEVYVKDVTLGRGERLELDAELDMTAQRIASWSLISLAGVSAGVGIVLAALSVSERAGAQKLLDDAASLGRPLTIDEAQSYNAALDQRDRFNGAAGSAFAFSALSAGLGVLLYLTDDPDLYDAARENDTAGELHLHVGAGSAALSVAF